MDVLFGLFGFGYLIVLYIVILFIVALCELWFCAWRCLIWFGLALGCVV